MWISFVILITISVICEIIYCQSVTVSHPKSLQVNPPIRLKRWLQCLTILNRSEHLIFIHLEDTVIQSESIAERFTFYQQTVIEPKILPLSSCSTFCATGKLYLIGYLSVLSAKNNTKRYITVQKLLFFHVHQGCKV